MKNKFAEKGQAEEKFKTLPNEILDFKLKKIYAEDEDKFIYFNFENEKSHRTFTAYFHDETAEYKVRVKIGLTEFCLTEFFTSDFEKFSNNVQAKLESVLKNFFDDEKKYTLIAKKKFTEWQYGQNLKKNIGNFELFISPDRPVKFTNGSHVIINYSDFEAENDLTIYYNIYGDNFAGETRKSGVPQVIYSFDAENLQELETKLKENLIAELEKLEA